MFRKLLARLAPPRALAPPLPDEPLCIIGDLHGCLNLFQNLLSQIPEGYRILQVGDIVDRGEQTAELLQFLATRDDITCLRGNHEDMLLSFLDDPTGRGAGWPRYGGLQTLGSFGVKGAREQMDHDALQACSAQFKTALGPDLEGWIRGLDLSFQSGNVLVSHAGANPHLPISQQNKRDLIWGHPDFTRQRREDDLWVAYGHIIQKTLTVSEGRIAVDTGAYFSGRLTAALVYDGRVNRLEVTA